MNRRFAITLAAAAIVAVVLLGLFAPSATKPRLVLMTGLPLVWGEGDIDETLSGAREPAAAYRWLVDQYALTVIDRIDALALRPSRLLLLAQPRALAPAELVALDDWVRGGGRAVVFADPLLMWDSRYPPGDARAPPPMSLLDPLLAHWGLRLDLRDARSSAGQLLATRAGCAVEGGGAVARCAVGQGRIVVIADADLLDDRLWPSNKALVEGWLSEATRTGDEP